MIAIGLGHSLYWNEHTPRESMLKNNKVASVCFFLTVCYVYNVFVCINNTIKLMQFVNIPMCMCCLEEKMFWLLFGDNCVLYFGKVVANERRHYLDNANCVLYFGKVVANERRHYLDNANCVLYFGKVVANERRHYLDNAKMLKDMFCEYLKKGQFDHSVTQYNSVGSCWC